MEIHRLVMAAELQWREKAGISLSIHPSIYLADCVD